MRAEKFVNPAPIVSFLYKAVILIPCLVLIGWQFKIGLLKSMLPSLIAMNPTTAVLFIVSGISLYLVNQKNYKKHITWGRYMGLLIAIIAIIRFIGLNEEWDMRIDQKLFGNILYGNRMAITTIVCFILSGFSLFLIDTLKNIKYNISQFLGFLVFLISLQSMVYYLYASMSLSGSTIYIPIALHTAITLLVLASGILLSRPDKGFVSVILHKKIGGIIARRLLPISIFIPIITNGLRLEGQQLNLYNTEFGSALGVVSIIVIFSVLTWWVAGSLNKTDVNRQISDTKLFKAKEDLAESELKYRNLIENSGVIMYTTSLNGRITYASSKAFELTGYEADELTGKSFTDFLEAKSMPVIIEKYKDQLQKNIQESVYEFCICTKSGEIKQVEQSAVLIMENGAPTGFQCIITDISEKKEMEEMLKGYQEKLIENQELLQSILDNATSLIYIKDLDGKYILINQEFKKALNVTDDMVIGKTDFDFTEHIQAEIFKQTDAQVIATCKPLEIEREIEMVDGKHNLLIVKFPLLDAQNKIYGISGIATDITERAKYQEQLIKAKQIAEDGKKLQEEFLANMSHEIRTPMNGIHGMTDLLLDSSLDEEQYEFAKTIKHSADNLLVIINDILDFSKIKAGKLTIEQINFSLNEILTNIQKTFKQRLAEKHLEFQINTGENIPDIICGDPYRLTQVLVNLIGNAIKFTEKGNISITVSAGEFDTEGLTLHFAVSDTGIGIEEDSLAEIFQSFTQASYDITRKYGGTGLGLAICRQLLHLQNGDINVISTPGAGSVFGFHIYYRYASISANGVIEKNITDKEILSGKHFLIAEDNLVNQKVIVKVIKKAGGFTDVVNNGLEAVERLKEGRKYDFIIMDLQMPVMDGYKATDMIRNELCLQTPIIAMTATALQGERLKCLQTGMNDYLSKPFVFHDFYQCVKNLVYPEVPLGQYVNKEHTEISENKLYDLCMLKEMEDEEYTLDILNIYLKETPLELKKLKTAAVHMNGREVCSIAHKLKSSAGLLQINKMCKILDTIEEATQTGEVNGPTLNMVNEVISLYQKTQNLLKQEIEILQSKIPANL